MKKILFLMISILMLLITFTVDADVSYSIPYYSGELMIHEDNTADFKQTIDYHFDSKYNGQIVTLGRAGEMPPGFSILSKPVVTTYRNGNIVESHHEFSHLGDGYKLKIFNAGNKGDDVRVVVHWQLQQMLFVYQDIAELNWVPISDWDRVLGQVDFKVKTDRHSEDKELVAHRGYFKDVPAVSFHDNSYQVTAKNVSGQLEFHAYWDADIITTNFRLFGRQKENFKKTEKNISDKQKIIQLLFSLVFPLAIAFSVMVSLLFYWLFKKKIKKNYHFNKKTHLFALPDDLPPLVVADYIYGKTLSNSLEMPQAFIGTIKFEHLLKACLLDLIDRKIIKLSKNKRLEIVSLEAAEPFEKDFIKFAFGDRQNIPIQKLFSNYHFDDYRVSELKQTYKGSELEEQIKLEGNTFIDRLKKQLSQISTLVSQNVQTRELKKLRRDMTSEDKKYYRPAMIFMGIAILFSLVAFCTFLVFGEFISMFSLGYAVTGIALMAVLIYYSIQETAAKRFGILKSDGQEIVQRWVSFTNMLRDIHKFDKVDIEGLVVWNRVLVYATMLGYAKKVEDYIKINHIKINDDSMYASYLFIKSDLDLQTSALFLSNQSANSASHFSVSSSGSSGGGFSGGGGGGGGGAF